jgi:hypothetical protein
LEETNVRKLLAVVGATLFMTACGGIETEEASQELGQTEQGLSTAATTCPAGYTIYREWDCAPLPECGGRNGNFIVTYCTSATDTFVLNPKSSVRCGACY